MFGMFPAITQALTERRQGKRMIHPRSDDAIDQRDQGARRGGIAHAVGIDWIERRSGQGRDRASQDLHPSRIAQPGHQSFVRSSRNAAAILAWMTAAVCMSGIAWADAPRSIAHVAACGLEFELPAGYRITRPKRIEEPRDGRRCAFDIVDSRPAPPRRGECKDKDDGGEPPYDVCDWMLDDGPQPSSVQVARTNAGGTPLVDSFSRGEDGRWMVPNAQAGDQPAESIDFFGKPAWKGETIVRMYWRRQRVKDYTGIYGGSGGADVTLVQFAPDLHVQLQNPPADEDGTCTTFCASLRLGARGGDLP